MRRKSHASDLSLKGWSSKHSAEQPLQCTIEQKVESAQPAQIMIWAGCNARMRPGRLVQDTFLIGLRTRIRMVRSTFLRMFMPVTLSVVTR